MFIRKYQSADCGYLAELFYNTVHSVNEKDYTHEQLNAWADGKVDLTMWDRALSEHYSVVVVEDGVIVGFGDIDKAGYIDRLYVHKDYQRRGIGTAICNKLEGVCDADKIFTHASITAKPFFCGRGYKTVRGQQVVKKGIGLTNYIMVK